MTMLSRLGSSAIQPISSVQRIAIIGGNNNNYSVRQISQLKFDQLPVPAKAKLQTKPPPGEVGFYRYERYWSRDPRYKPQMYRDTPTRFFFYGLEHEWELWPVCVLFLFSCSLVVIITVVLFQHIEIWLDRSKKVPPWDWSRIRDNYWKLTTFMYDPTGVSHQRLYTMEKLQDELLEAARQRGTRE